jgi:hypothetical protein
MALALENTQGELNEIEEAVHCYETCTIGGMTQAECAEKRTWKQNKVAERYITGHVCNVSGQPETLRALAVKKMATHLRWIATARLPGCGSC